MFHGDFRRRDGVAKDVLAELLAFRPILWWHRTPAVHVEAGVLPGGHPLFQFRWNSTQADQFGEDAGTEDLSHDRPGNLWCRVPPAFGIPEPVGHQGVKVGMEVQVFDASNSRFR